MIRPHLNRMKAGKNAEMNKCSDTGKPVYSRNNSFFNMQQCYGNRKLKNLLNIGLIQPKLKISNPRDDSEREADKVADHVMQTGEEKVKSTSCPEKQAVPGSSGGHPLPGSIRSFFEPKFGADFSGVRIHTNSRAENAAGEVNAKAFTYGNNIIFGKGEYSPQTNYGKKLLAHELTHVVQQRNGPKQISRVPNPAPPPDPYVPGRPAHNHPALGVWPAVQANASAVCARESVTVTPPSPLPPIPVPIPTSKLGRVECVCASLSPLQVLNAAKTFEMMGQPLAIQHLDHYISGGGADFVEHSNLDDLMNTDAGARGVIVSAIARADRGNVFIRQSDYRSENFKRAFGGIDRVDYQVNRAAGTVDVWFKDRYDFHPAGFGHTNMGAGDSAPPGRVTNCVHHAAVEAKSSGAADYWMFGHATLPLSLFVSGPSGGAGSIE